MTSVSELVRKRWPCATSSCADLGEVVDLAVEDDPDRAVLVAERLIAGREVDDAQPAVAEADAAVEIVAAGVGTAVRDGVGHRHQPRAIDRVCRVEVESSCNPAHVQIPAACARCARRRCRAARPVDIELFERSRPCVRTSSAAAPASAPRRRVVAASAGSLNRRRRAAASASGVAGRHQQPGAVRARSDRAGRRRRSRPPAGPRPSLRWRRSETPRTARAARRRRPRRAAPARPRDGRGSCTRALEAARAHERLELRRRGPSPTIWNCTSGKSAASCAAAAISVSWPSRAAGSRR